MKTNQMAAAVAAAFMTAAGAAYADDDPATDRYIYIDGGFAGVGSSFETESGARIAYDVDYFSALIEDTYTQTHLLCSGLRITTPEGTEAGEMRARTASWTLAALWRKVAGGPDHVAEYGACVEVEPWEVGKRNVESLFGGSGTGDGHVIFRADPAPPLDLWEFERRLLEEKYPELYELREESERWDDFTAGVEQYLDERSYSPDQNASACAGAGFYWDEALAVRSGTFEGVLPVCPWVEP